MMHGGRTRTLLKILLLQSLLAGPLAAAEREMPRTEDELEAMVEDDRADEAYRALDADRGHRDEAWHQYLLALAALESGRTKEAVDRFEKYVKAHPKQDPARFHLARAYAEGGANDRAIAQLRHVYDTSAFEASRERARDELSRMGAMPVIPVGTEKEKVPVETPEFDPENTAVAGELFGGTGYDTNPGFFTETERFFIFTRLPEERDGESVFYNAGGSLQGSWAPRESLAVRGGFNASARMNPDADFADTEDAAVQTQVRWSGPHQRWSTGIAYSVSTLDGNEYDNAYAIGSMLELLTPALLVSAGGEAARVRFPGEPLRNVDTFFMRTEVTTPPRDAAVWVPRAAVIAGFEEETEETSPFGRSLWGAVLGLNHFFTANLSANLDTEFTKSMYDGTFTQPDRRSDDRWGLALFGRWRPDERSRWEHALGGRYTVNNSNEPDFDFRRTMIGYEIIWSWGKKAK